MLSLLLLATWLRLHCARALPAVAILHRDERGTGPIPTLIMVAGLAAFAIVATVALTGAGETLVNRAQCAMGATPTVGPACP